MSDRPGRDVGGIVGCGVAIAAGALAWYYAKDFSAMGAVFPRTVAAAMMLFAAAYIAAALLRPSARAAPAPGSVWRRAALVAVMAAWSVLLEKVGFLSTSVACYTAILVIANYDRWTPRMAVGYAVVGATVLGGLYAIFRFVLQVPLPQGILL
jgi:putative tricarboxylic transport membrane protein